MDELEIDPPINGGVFCAGQRYTIRGVCENAIASQFLVPTVPTNVNPDTIIIETPNNLESVFIFPIAGMYDIQLDCIELAP